MKATVEPIVACKYLNILSIEDRVAEVCWLQNLLSPEPDVRLALTRVDRLGEAIACLHRHAYDIVVSDVLLADGAGVEIVKQLLQIPRCPPIAIAAEGDDLELALQLIEAGAQDYFVKSSLDSQQLIRTICYAIKRHQREIKYLSSEEFLDRVIDALEAESKSTSIERQIDSDRFFTLSPDLHCILGMDGEFKQLNPAWSQLLDRHPETLQSVSYLNFVHPEDRKTTIAEIQSLQAGAPTINFQNRYRCADNSYKWLHWHAVSYPEDGLIHAVARDITRQKQIEETLRHSKQRLADAQKVARVGDWEFNIITGQLTWSDEMFRLYGLDPSKMRDLPPEWEEINSSSAMGYEDYLNRVHPEDVKASQKTVQRAISSGQPYTLEQRIVLPDNEIRHLLLKGQPILNEGGQVIRLFGTALDITERKRLEQELVWREQHLRLVVQNMPVMLDAFDASDRLIVWNRECERVTGYNAAEIVNNPKALELLYPDPDYRQQMMAQWYEVGNDFRDWEWNVSCKDGSVKTVLWSNVSQQFPIAGWVGWAVGIDITERKRAEEELRRSQERLQLALDGSVLGLWDWHVPTNYFYVSPQWLEMLGYEVSEIEESCSAWQQLIHPEDLPGMRETSNAHLAGNTPVYAAEYRIATKQGEWKWILARGKVFDRDEEGNPLRMTGTYRDISDRKAVEQMKDEFISIVSHELRTPLTAILGSLKLLATGKLGDLSTAGRRMLEIAVNNTDRLSRLVNDILDLQRIESGQLALKKTSCNAVDLVVQAAEGMQAIAQKHEVQVCLNVGNEEGGRSSILMLADADYILQVLENLLSNAIKFSDPESMVWLAVERREMDVLFRVEDRGRGIPADKLENIFGRFQQVDASDSRQKGGTGLGLAICHRIVELHGGRIWVESQLGRGSIFYFTCPGERSPQA